MDSICHRQSENTTCCNIDGLVRASCALRLKSRHLILYYWLKMPLSALGKQVAQVTFCEHCGG